VFHKISEAARLLREEGFSAVFALLRTKYKVPIPQTAKSKWKAGCKAELAFWDTWFRTKGAQWPHLYAQRLACETPLDPRVAALLPDSAKVTILDVGAGPLTCLGKTVEGKEIAITAVDALADEYDKLLKKYQIRPVVRTEKAQTEQLTRRFAPNMFDLVYARNCIDHSYQPLLAIDQMLTVVKTNGYVLMQHHPNEAEGAAYRGLHQWNFTMTDSGDCLITSRNSEVNITQKYKDVCDVTCELLPEGRKGWLVTRLRKK